MRSRTALLLAVTLGLGLPAAAHADSGCTRSVTWKYVSERVVKQPEAQFISQGMTTDGKQWFFSWEYGLQRVNDNNTIEAARPYAIPYELAQEGVDHIGDIDYYNGKLVLPLEDGSKNYQHPYLAFANPRTLAIGSFQQLPWDLQTEGVPWVAVEASKGIAFTAEWNKTTQLNVWNLNNHFNLLGHIKLSHKLPRIQGAKYYKGTLIATVDDDANSVYQIDLRTGKVHYLFATNQGREEEGLGLRLMPDGSLIHIIQMFHHSGSGHYYAKILNYARVVSSSCGSNA